VRAMPVRPSNLRFVSAPRRFRRRAGASCAV